MKLDMILAVRSVTEVAGIAKAAEEFGFDGVWSISDPRWRKIIAAFRGE